MKKKYNYLLALAVFLVIMICFNKFGYIISYLAAIGGPLVMGNNGTMVVYEFLMSHLNLVSAILYLMVLPIPALWYYLAFQLREGGIRAIPGKCRRVGWDGCVLIALFTFGMIHVTSIILAIVARSLPDAMDNYQNLIENSGQQCQQADLLDPCGSFPCSEKHTDQFDGQNRHSPCPALKKQIEHNAKVLSHRGTIPVWQR